MKSSQFSQNLVKSVYSSQEQQRRGVCRFKTAIGGQDNSGLDRNGSHEGTKKRFFRKLKREKKKEENERFKNFFLRVKTLGGTVGQIFDTCTVMAVTCIFT